MYLDILFGEIWTRSVDDSIVSIGNKLGSGRGRKKLSTLDRPFSVLQPLRAPVRLRTRDSGLGDGTKAEHGERDRPPEAASRVRADAARPYREVIVMARDRGCREWVRPIGLALALSSGYFCIWILYWGRGRSGLDQLNDSIVSIGNKARIRGGGGKNSLL